MKKKRDSMTISSRMGKGFVLFAFITTQTLGVSQAQTADPNTSNAGQVLGAIGGVAANFGTALPGNIYSQNPAQLMLQQQQQMLQNKLLECQAIADGTAKLDANGQVIGGGVIGTAVQGAQAWDKLKNRAKEVGKGAKSGTTASTSTDECKCTDYAGETELTCPTGKMGSKDDKNESIFQSRVSTFKDEAVKERTEIGVVLKCYKDLKENKNCPPGRKELANAQKAMNCMMDKMNEATGLAAQALQQALAANQAQYAKMNQYQGEVAEQIAQVEAILGPDDKFGGASGEFKGLIGLQNELQEQLMKAKDGEASFEENLTKIDQDEKSNEQTLEAERVQVVASCLKGDATASSGGRSLMCPKPQTIKGQDGKEDYARLANGAIKYINAPCGPLDYLRARIKQQAMMDNGRYMDRDAARAQESEAMAASYEGAIDAIMREMGSYEQPTDAGRLKSSVSDWEDIAANKQIMGKLRELDSDPKLRGVNIVANLQKATQKCTTDSKRWKNNQVQSGASRYNKAKQQIDSARKKLNASLDNGLADLNRSYKNIMSVLSDIPVNSPRFHCAKDSAKMMECYKNIRQNVADLLEGTGRSGFVTKQIKGGTMIGPISVPCRGINACVTALKTVRDRQKEHVNLAQKVKLKFVADGNNMVQKQLQDFSSVLQVGSRMIQAHFAAMKNKLGELGVTEMPKLNMMQGAALKPGMGGPEGKEPGPFEMPESMAGVLSQMAGGIPDPANSGVDGAISAANEKFKAKSDAIDEKIAELKKAEKAYSVAKVDACFRGMNIIADGDTDKKDPNSVNNMTDECNNETASANSDNQQAVTLSDLGTLYAQMDQIFKAASAKKESVWSNADFTSKMAQFEERKYKFGCTTAGKTWGQSALKAMDTARFGQ